MSRTYIHEFLCAHICMPYRGVFYGYAVAEVCNVHVNMHVYNFLVCPFICYNVVLLSHSYVVDICIDISLTIYSADEH